MLLHTLVLIALRCPTGPGFFLIRIPRGDSMDKTFTTISDQIGLLKSRGLLVDDDRVKEVLKMENYYNVINGYKELFIDKNYAGTDERYKPGANFEELYALYLFDRELRNIFMKYILIIENNIKTVLAHDFSAKYGHDNYLKIDNFEIKTKKREKKTPAQKIGAISELIANIQREISRQLSRNNQMISHNMLHYGYVPLWVLVNALTLGTISIFYSYLKEKDQNDIGRRFNLKPDEMTKILFILTIYRNACAHDERFYNLKALKSNMRPNSIKTHDIHDAMRIPRNSSNNPISGKNDLFAITIISKLILDRDCFDEFAERLRLEIEDIKGRLHTIKVETILEDMGFPLNWYDIKHVQIQ